MAGGETVCGGSPGPAGGAVDPPAVQRGRRARLMWKGLARDARQKTGKPRHSDRSLLTHGLQHVRHIPCQDAVRFMSCSDGAGGFLSVHQSGYVRFYHPDGRLRASSLHSTFSVTYKGLTNTQLPNRLVGWGSGPTLTLLDSQLTPLMHAVDPLDVRVCQVVDSQELVTAGAGNVCVWCLGHMLCRVRVLEGFGRGAVFTLLALAPAAAGKGPRALAVSERAVTVVDLTEGRVLEHKSNLHLRYTTDGVAHPRTHQPLPQVHLTLSALSVQVISSTDRIGHSVGVQLQTSVLDVLYYLMQAQSRCSSSDAAQCSAVHCLQDIAHRTLPSGHCPQGAALRTLPIGPCPQEIAHQMLPSGRCPQGTALRTLPTGCCPQGAALRVLHLGCCPQDAALRVLPIIRCPQDIAHRMLPSGCCPQDAALRTLPSGRCPQDTALSSVP
ncbi:hypothetical protein NFI96_006128 [Prochilodus magdalenae]|nr:hypothetical protein NFI96_006128 [Prochilodus magdalenae]